MAKRNARPSSSTFSKNTRIASSDSLNALEQQVIAIAEQLGRIAGTAQARTNGWLIQPAFRSKLARIRKRAARLLSRLNAAERSTEADERQKRSRQQSRARVAAPGKKHRKAPEPS